MHRHALLPLLLVILLTSALLPTPVPRAAAASDSPFGANTHIASTYPAVNSMATPADVIARSGSGWVREEFQWGRIEPRPGQYDWAFTDAAVGALSQRGVNILGLFNPAVPWGTPDRSDDGVPPAVGSFYAPDPQAFARFAANVVTRYRGTVKYWQVWNEPENPVYWRPAPDLAAYANLLKVTAAAIKAADPSAQVVAAGVASPEPAGSYLQTLYDNGAWNSFDIVALHPYTDPAGPEAGAIDSVGIGAVRTLVQRLGNKPIWVTEYGWSVSPSDRVPGYGFDLQTQADYLIRSMALLRQAGVERIMMFRFKDMQLRGGQPFNAYGLLGYGDGQADYSRVRPAFTAMQTLNREVGGRTPLGVSRLSDAQVAYDFERTINWTVFPAGNGSITTGRNAARGGNAGGELRYAFNSGGNDYVGFTPRERISLPAGTTQLGLWVYGDGSAFDVKVQLRDGSGEVLQYRLGKIGGAGWQQLIAPINTPVEPGNRIANYQNGTLDGEISLAMLVIDDDPDTRSGNGTVLIDDLTGYRGPQAFAARFAEGNGQVVDLVWSLDGGEVRLPTGSAQVQIIDRDGSSRPLAASGGSVTLAVGGRPFYVRHTPAAAAVTPVNPGPVTPAGGFVAADGSFADTALQNVWQRSDLPIAAAAAGLRARSWLWGPAPISGAMREAYAESPGGTRLVQYFDKSRMEINNPAAARNDWYVTNGRLVVELLTGAVQLGDAQFEQRSPADQALAGDPAAANPNAPTYASLRSVAFPVQAGANPNRVGQPVTAFLARDGSVSDRPDLAGYAVTIGAYESTLGRNVAQVFIDYQRQQGLIYSGGRYSIGPVVDGLFALGLPISDPYWSRVSIGGVEQDVLIQAFERRVLTYTPANAAEWRVEMGNVGRHYVAWRYGQ
jgi:hypothetical protein